MAKLVADVYGDALFELALEQDRMKDYTDEAKAIVLALQENPELMQMMNHPSIGKDEKLEMVETIFKGKASDEVVGLMLMVVEKNHFADMEAIFQNFILRAMEHENIGIAYVTTPTELSDAKKKEVEDKLLETTKYVSFQMNYTVDPSLIGGMVIRIGDRVVDSSVRTKINNLSRELSKIQLKVGESTP